MAQAAQAFEANALGQLLAPMFDTVDSAHGLFGGGDGEATWRPILTQELAKHIAAHGGIGLAAPVLRQMIQMQEAA
jgi:Rod binding domain-containing protein